DMMPDLSVFGRVIEPLQPAQVADMDHSADARSELDEYPIGRDILYKPVVTAAHRELDLDGVPRIFAKLLDRQAHLPRILVERHDLGIVLVAQFEEFLALIGVLAHVISLTCTSPSTPGMISKNAP